MDNALGTADIAGCVGGTVGRMCNTFKNNILTIYVGYKENPGK
jgi:hypothetical protein